MDPVIQGLVIAITGFIAGSGGFWVYLTRKYEKRDAVNKLIMGLAHDKIVFLGMRYIEKGFVTKDEYDDLFKYFWEPYQALGGDGSAERIVRLVDMLPLKPEFRRDVELRHLVDRLEKGTETVLDKVERGEDDLERPKYYPG